MFFLFMTVKELSSFIDSLEDDEVLELIKLIKLRTARKIDTLVFAASGIPKCPKCGKEMVKNGTTPNKSQKWICKDCKISSSTNTNKFTFRTKLKAVHRIKMYEAFNNGFSLRKTANLCKVSLTTAFYCRQKLFKAMGQAIEKAKLKDRIEVDGKQERLSFKGIIKEKMPRKSKKRGGGTGKADPKERLNVMFAIDSSDSAVGKITGVARENHEQINKIMPYFKNVNTLVTDDNSAYRKYSIILNAKHVHINSSIKYDPITKETLNNINSLMSDFDHFMNKYRGVSSRHLQSYIDSYLFQKMLKYKVDECELVKTGIRECLSVDNTKINNADIRTRKFPINLYKIFNGCNGWIDSILAKYYQ